MCTAIYYHTRNHYFGRTLDLDRSYQEAVTITPRNKVLPFRHRPAWSHHYAIIGMAYVSPEPQTPYPLYYDAVNEFGLAMAGLRFPQLAVYHKPVEGVDNVASFEWILWILGQCRNVSEARQLLETSNLTDETYSETLPPSPLHWMLADLQEAIVAEPLKEGMKLYNCPIGVLTNGPTFDYQMFRLNEYRNVSPYEHPQGSFSERLAQEPYSLGLSAKGLPGDNSSTSRFVCAAYTKLNSICGESEEESVSQFFHILDTVSQVRGTVRLPDGSLEQTIYTSCCNQEQGIYYYKTYENSRITAVSLHHENLDSTELVSYPIHAKTANLQ